MTAYVGSIPLDAILVIASAVSVGIVRALLTRLLQPIADKRCVARTKKSREDLKRKFFEASYKTLHYVVAFGWELLLLYPVDWYIKTTKLWENLPQPMSLSFYVFYNYQMGFYAYSLVSVLFFDTRRHDWIQLIVHHIATEFLLVYSWGWGLFRVGLLVLVLHDCSDIFLEGAKCFNYIGLKTITTVLFVLLVITFFICRLVLYPLVCLRSTLFEADVVIAAQGIHYEWYEKPLFNGLLIVLFLLQIYWFRELLKVVRRALSGSALSDHREQGAQSVEKDEKSQ